MKWAGGVDHPQGGTTGGWKGGFKNYHFHIALLFIELRLLFLLLDLGPPGARLLDWRLALTAVMAIFLFSLSWELLGPAIIILARIGILISALLPG